MKEILVSLFVLLSCSSFAQEKLPFLKRGEGKRYLAIFPDSKGAEYSVYFSEKKGDRYFVECQVKALDGVTSFRFWQQYQWKLGTGYAVELVEAYVFSTEMKKPQKFTTKDLNMELGVPLTQSLVHPYTPFEILSKRPKKTFELNFKDQIKGRPVIINPAKAEELDEKGKEILSLSYSCL